MQFAAAFEADQQPLELREPRDRALGDPPVTPEALGTLDAFAPDARADAASAALGASG